MSRIKWQLARNSCLDWQFHEPPDQWPEHFSPRQLANLQACSATNSRALDAERSALKKAIEDAVKAEEIPHAIKTFTFPSRVLSWGGGPREFHSEQLPAIAANDFAQWLNEQQETSSKHIQAWFDSCCTDTTPVVAQDAPENQVNAMKKAALIAELEYEWSSIEVNISEATRNGLKGAAHTASMANGTRTKPAPGL